MVKKFRPEWYLRIGTLAMLKYLPKNLLDTNVKISASMLLVMYCILSQVISCSRPRVASLL